MLSMTRDSCWLWRRGLSSLFRLRLRFRGAPPVQQSDGAPQHLASARQVGLISTQIVEHGLFSLSDAEIKDFCLHHTQTVKEPAT